MAVLGDPIPSINKVRYLVSNNQEADKSARLCAQKARQPLLSQLGNCSPRYPTIVTNAKVKTPPVWVEVEAGVFCISWAIPPGRKPFLPALTIYECWYHPVAPLSAAHSYP